MSEASTKVVHCEECEGKGWKTYIYYIEGKKIIKEGSCWKCGGHGKYPSHLDK